MRLSTEPRFTANPSSTAPGQTVTLSWTVTGSPTSLTIDNGVGAVSGSSTTVNPTATTTYTLTAMNSNGKDTETTVVTVGSEPEPPTNDVPNYGRWIVYFEAETVAYVYELDITEVVKTANKDGGQGQYLFCHVNLNGTPCSTFSKSEGTGFTGKFTYSDGRIVNALTLSGGELGGEFMSGYELTFSKTNKGEAVISGPGELIPPGSAEEIFGTIRAVNIAEPRDLE